LTVVTTDRGVDKQKTSFVGLLAALDPDHKLPEVSAPAGVKPEEAAHLAVVQALLMPPPPCMKCMKRRRDRIERGACIFDSCITEADAILRRKEVSDSSHLLVTLSTDRDVLSGYCISHRSC
jgi:hypothetical protein